MTPALIAKIRGNQVVGSFAAAGPPSERVGIELKPARCGSRDSPRCRTGGEWPGCYISPRRLRGRRLEDNQEEALRLRIGWRLPRAQIACIRSVDAWISACDW